MPKLIYLAAPYYHDNPVIRQWRVELTDKAAAYLMQRDLIVFSPLSHSHRIARHMDNCGDHDFWLKQDFAWLRLCHRLYVLTVPGWLSSHGVMLEIEEAKRLGVPVHYIEPRSVGIDMAVEMKELKRRQKERVDEACADWVFHTVQMSREELTDEH